MKTTILILAILFFSVLCNAQSFYFKVEPFTFEDETRKMVTVKGIRAKMISNIDCNLSDSTFYRQFYIDFKTTTSENFKGLNSDTGIMSSELAINMNIPLGTAKAFIKDICRKLEYGTIAEKYTAAGQLAGGYGYTLKPLSEQKE